MAQRNRPLKKLGVLLFLVAIAVISIYAWRHSPVPAASPTAAPSRGPSTSEGAVPEGMVLVPGGVFRMGSNDHRMEAPQRDAPVDPFFIDRFPVTNLQFREFVKASGHRATGLWKNYDTPGRERHPVVHVTWDDAAAYAQWAGKRLPTEAEWEKAARGVDGRVFPWGSEADLTRLNLSGKDTTPVDAHPTGCSPYGAYDLAGNVFEWTAERLSLEVMEQSNAPGEDPLPFIIKGGCHLYSLNWCRSSYFYHMLGSRSSYVLGFRCVRSADSVQAEKEKGKPFHPISPRQKYTPALESGDDGYDEAARQIINNGTLEPVKDIFARYYVDFMGLQESLAARGSLDVADIGSGPGFPSIYMARTLGPRATLHAVDVSRSVVAYLQDLREHHGFQNVHPVLSVRTDVSLPPESMDFVFCLGTYAYTISNEDDVMGKRYQKSARPFLQSIHKALRPGGVLAIFNASRMLQWQQARTQVEHCGFKTVKVEFKRDDVEKYSALFRKVAPPE